MKKNGSILIESLCSICMFMIIIDVLVKSMLLSSNSLKQRKESTEIKDIIFNIENEIKYNITTSEEVFLVEGNKLNIKYSVDLNQKLISKKLFELEGGDDITISCDETYNHYKLFSIKFNKEKYLGYNYQFKKEWWMYNI